MAEAVGLTVEAFEAQHDAGETFYQIALAEDFTAEEIPALMQAARANALDAAAKDGVISQEQADWMNSRGHGGYGNGACPMYEDGQEPGAGFGPGMMRGWSGQGQQ